MNYNIPLELVDIEGEGYHLTVNVSVNGKPARMVLDTGASRTVFDLNCLKGFETEQEEKEEDRLSTGVGSNSLKSYSIIFAEFNAALLSLCSISAQCFGLYGNSKPSNFSWSVFSSVFNLLFFIFQIFLDHLPQICFCF